MGGPSQLLVTAARQNFIDKNQAALVDYFEDNLWQIAWYFDPANHDEVLKIVTDLPGRQRRCGGGGPSRQRIPIVIPAANRSDRSAQIRRC